MTRIKYIDTHVSQESIVIQDPFIQNNCSIKLVTDDSSVYISDATQSGNNLYVNFYPFTSSFNLRAEVSVINDFEVYNGLDSTDTNDALSAPQASSIYNIANNAWEYANSLKNAANIEMPAYGYTDVQTGVLYSLNTAQNAYDKANQAFLYGNNRKNEVGSAILAKEGTWESTYDWNNTVNAIYNIPSGGGGTTEGFIGFDYTNNLAVCGSAVPDISNNIYAKWRGMFSQPVCGVSVTNMAYSYADHPAALNGYPVCGPLVTNMANAYSNCAGLTGSPVCGDNVVDFAGAYWHDPYITGSPVCGPKVAYMTEAYNGCTRLTGRPVVEDNVIYMSGCYYGCSNLTGSPVIPPRVNNMSKAYYNCRNLSGFVSLHNSREFRIAENTFALCTGLSSCNIEVSSNTNLAYTFASCTGLIRANVNTNGNAFYGVFQGCSNLKYVNTECINHNGGTGAFAQCYNLTGNINIKHYGWMNRWDENMFRNCYNLEGVTWYDHMNNMNGNQFTNCFSRVAPAGLTPNRLNVWFENLNVFKQSSRTSLITNHWSTIAEASGTVTINGVDYSYAHEYHNDAQNVYVYCGE